MMNEKLKKVVDITNKANSDEIEVWTETFRAKGKLCKDAEKLVEGIVSLENVKLYSYLEVYECESEDYFEYDWLNIFEDKIIAFVAFKK